MALTEREFRRLALSFPGALESSHMHHPDFRVGGKIFATLRYPSRGWAMVKLPKRAQEKIISAAPDVFSPVKGAWGRGGATLVKLAAARKADVRAALEAAWRNIAPRKLQKASS